MGHRAYNQDNYKKRKDSEDSRILDPKKAGGGLDIVDLETYLRDYLDRFSYYELEKAEKTDPHIVGCRMLQGLNRDLQFYKDVERVVTQAMDKPFQHSALNAQIMFDCFQCLCVGLPYWTNPCTAKNDNSAYICSELVGEVYIESGLVKAGICGTKLNPGEMVPPHFDSTRKLRLREGLTLSAEHIVVGPETLEARSAMRYPPIHEGAPSLNSTRCGAGGFFHVDTMKEVLTAPPQAQMQASEGELDTPLMTSMELAPGN